MNTKLTLSIEAQVVEGAKEYAKKQGRSLSNIVEEYLKSVSKPKKKMKKSALHPLVEELCGSVKIPKDKSYDEILEKARIDKYLKR